MGDTQTLIAEHVTDNRLSRLKLVQTYSKSGFSGSQLFWRIKNILIEGNRIETIESYLSLILREKFCMRERP